MLNSRQEKFVNNLISGMTQRQAYKDAYNANYDDDAIDKKASALFNKDEVQSRYKELLEKAQNEAIMTAIERKKWLSDVVNDIQREEANIKNADGEEICIGLKNADLNTKLKAIDILNKMEGEYRTILGGSVEVKKKLEDIL